MVARPSLNPNSPPSPRPSSPPPPPRLFCLGLQNLAQQARQDTLPRGLGFGECRSVS